MRKRSLRRNSAKHRFGQRALRLETLESRMVLATGPVLISEFLADNRNAVFDEDGDDSDFIELYNPTADSVDLDGWHLTDDAGDLSKWTFPAITLDAGEYLTLFASSKDRTNPASQLHTNFGLASSGEYLALVQSDGETIAHEFSPEYPSQEENISYGLAQDVTTLLPEGATARYLVPNAGHAGLGDSWANPAFNVGGWGSGPTGVGYSELIDNFEVTYIEANTAISNLTVAEQVIADPGLHDFTTTVSANVINYLNTGGGGNFGSDSPFPTQTINVDENDFLIEARAQIIIPSAGDWTFGVNSDDGFSLDLTGQGDSFSVSFPNPRGASDTLGVFSVATPGVYDLRLVIYERGGGASGEMFAAEGSHGSFNGNFRLIGDSAGGGLETVGFGGAIATDVGPIMDGVNSSLWSRVDFNVTDPDQYDSYILNLKYDDGAAIYLNGTEVARRNAGGGSLAWNASATNQRLPGDATTAETINLTPFRDLLVDGNNVLAIHGLNFNANDDEFLLLPEVVGVKNDPVERYFSEPSPGQPNRGEFVSFVADTKFSVDRGFYDDPIQVDITSATVGATIYYTTDGSDPAPNNGTAFTNTLTIDQTTTLRARAYRNGFEPTDIDTHTYVFLDDVIQQSPDGSAPTGWPVGPVNGQIFDYGMDPEIVNDPVWGPQMRDALTQISTISLVTDVANIVDPGIGIYTNAGGRGSAWERPVSVELLSPDGSEEGFQHDSGLRIRGGFSRSDNNPKHSFRLFFKNDYDGDLNYALFGDEGVDQFSNLDLRTAQNYSWAFGGDSRNTINRDVFSRDLMRELQQPYTRSRYYHLYLNGQYWGLYQSEERPEADFAESYFGGDKDDYDVIKSTGSPGGYRIEATDGVIDNWHSLYQQSRDAYLAWEASAADPADRVYDESVYFSLRGLNLDGTRNESLPILLDVDNLIDYMITTFYAGNLDSPLSNFLGNARPNNWFSIYNRNGETGFQFMAHDSEHTLLNVNQNRVGPFFHANQDNLEYSNPQWLHQDLTASPEYRLRFADRVQQHFFNDGPLTPQPGIDRFLSRANEISQAIIAESARWGDSKQNNPLTKNNWQNTIDSIANSYLPQRTAVVLTQLQNADLYPSSAIAPAFRVNGALMHGGQISDTDLVSMFVPGESTDIPIVTLGSEWKYLDNGSNQGTSWRAPGFNDNSWASGDAELGYGDNDEATVVSFGNDPQMKHYTTYFRRAFSITDANDFTDLSLGVRRDDGAVVYLNGQEVARSNMPGGTILFDTPALGTVGGADEVTLQTFTVDPSLLVEGTNVFAVEIHQGSRNSSDISFDLTLSGAATVATDGVYFTTDGSDPREADGSINPNAVEYDQSFTLSQTTQLQARLYDPAFDLWSPLSDARFFVNEPASAANLALTELNYNPYDPTDSELNANPDLDNDDFEFIEFRNIGPNTIDLTGVQIVDGVTFTFAAGSQSSLAPGDFVLVVSDIEAFVLRYGDNATVAGEYSGGLTNNNGETIEVEDRFGQQILVFDYDDGGSWPGRADGDGSSLEVLDVDGDYSDSANWESSTAFNGTPGAERLSDTSDIVINEVLTHTDLPLVDSIEFLNTTGAPINVGGWWLTDSQSKYDKYVLPQNMTILDGGYLVLNESDFNPGGGAFPNDFALSSSRGEKLWLVETNSAGAPIRFVDSAGFGAAANGEALGLWPNGEGTLYPMVSRTLGFANSGPRVGPIVISEIMYNPPSPGGNGTDDHLEFIEIINPTSSEVVLSNWSISGIGFDFPAGMLLDSGESLVVVSFDPATDAALLADFNATYGVSNLALVGPYSGKLDNAGERITLHRADEPPAEEPDFYPQLLEDEINYGDTLPWPATADGGGDSLNRVTCLDWGNDPTSWFAAAPTPGSAACNPISSVIERFVFYNDSAFDGNDSGASPDDDNAIASNKEALRPGETAGPEHYISSADGITGIMIDIAELPGTTQLSATRDFAFRVGNSQDFSSWRSIAPPTISVRHFAGEQGSSRVTLTWPAGTITGHWLEVRLRANAETSLAADDVFYFGSAPGDANGNADVNAADFQAVRSNASSFLNPVDVNSNFDHNKDRRVDATDLLIVRDNTTTLATRLVMISPPGPAGKAAASSVTAKSQGLSTEADFVLLADTKQSSTTKNRVDSTAAGETPFVEVDRAIERYLAEYNSSESSESAVDVIASDSPTEELSAQIDALLSDSAE